MIEFGPRWLLLNRRIQLPLLLHQQAQQRSVNLSMNLMHVLIRFGSFFLMILHLILILIMLVVLRLRICPEV